MKFYMASRGKQVYEQEAQIFITTHTSTFGSSINYFHKHLKAKNIVFIISAKPLDIATGLRQHSKYKDIRLENTETKHKITHQNKHQPRTKGTSFELTINITKEKGTYYFHRKKENKTVTIKQLILCKYLKKVKCSQ